MNIQPIETRYAGHRFRSRLEARWAVFFDHLGIAWEYELQGYSLPSGPYLPDFLLSGLGGDARDGRLWFEVKPYEQRDVAFADDEQRWKELSQVTGLPLIVAFGMPRPDRDVVFDGDETMELFDGTGWDNYRAFATCPSCGRLGVTFEGRNRICDHQGSGGGDKIRTYDSPQIVAAYEAARSARFEHGESP